MTVHRPLRFGLIGTGEVMTQRHIPAIHRIPGAYVWNVLSRDMSRAAHIAHTSGALSKTPAYNDLGQLLADPDLDAVIIATPDALHADAAVAAAQAGKHIFVEKPMATTEIDALRIIRACANHGVKLAVGYHLRYHAGHRSLKQTIAAGAIGEPYHINLTWTYKAPEDDWRKDRARSPWWALAAVGTHSIDLVSYLLGLRPKSGSASRGVRWGENEHTAIINLDFENDATARILVSNCMVSPRTIEIEGTNGSVICKGTLGAYGTGEILINGISLSFESMDPYETQLRAFVQAIREDRAPEVGGDVGLQNVRELLMITKNTQRILTS